MYYTTYWWWFECAKKYFCKTLHTLTATGIYIVVRVLCVQNSHKIAINHKRLCFIKICVCVYYVFVRYIHVHTKHEKRLSRSTTSHTKNFFLLAIQYVWHMQPYHEQHTHIRRSRELKISLYPYYVWFRRRIYADKMPCNIYVDCKCNCRDDRIVWYKIGIGR